MTAPLKNYFAVTLLALIFFTGCKKETTPPSVLCDGKGSEAWWPLAPGNAWRYSSGETDSLIPHGVGIYEMTITNNPTDTLRAETNGDIYLKAPGLPEVLYLPGDLHVGVQWTGDYPSLGVKDTATVIDMNGIITNADCIYTGCAKVEIMRHYPTVIDTEYQYYKKGIGPVNRTYNNHSHSVTLIGITLN